MTVSIAGVAIMFASGIIVPIEGMPQWEQVFAQSFPMYYCADAFKGVMLSIPAHYALDAVVLVAWSLVGLLFSFVMLRRRQASL